MADIHAAVERNHKRQYEDALATAGRTDSAPKWEDLTEEQRANIRKVNNDHANWMNELGNSIRTGGPIPELP